MKTHVDRLPEYYPVNRLPSDWDQEEAREMATKRMLVIDDEMRIRILYKNIFDSIENKFHLSYQFFLKNLTKEQNF